MIQEQKELLMWNKNFFPSSKCAIFRQDSTNIYKKKSLTSQVYRVWFNRSWFVIHFRVLNCLNWILCYHKLYHDKQKTHSNISMDLYFWNFNHMKFISHEYANDHYLWTLWTLNYVHFVLSLCHISFATYNWALSNLKNLCFQISEKTWSKL